MGKKSVYADELRTRNPYFDKLEKMRAVMGRRNQRRANADAGQALLQDQALSSEHHSVDKSATTSGARPDESAVTSITSTDDDDANLSAPAIARSCEELIRKSALIGRLKSRVTIKDQWNQEGVAEMLCPARLERDIRDLETVVNRLERVVQNESKIAVYLQRPPKPCLLLDPRYHEAAARVLGENALKTVMEVVGAAEAIERFVRATSNDGDEETTALVTRLTDHLERQKNHLAYTMSVVKKGVDAGDKLG